MSYQQSSGFFQELKTTANMYFIISSAAFLQRNENAVMANIAAVRAQGWERLETQIRNTCLFCWCKSLNNHARNQLADWKRLKRYKKESRFSSNTHFAKKSLDCIEKSLITRPVWKSLGVAPVFQSNMRQKPAIVTSSEPLKICCHGIVMQWRLTLEKFVPKFGHAKESTRVNRGLSDWPFCGQLSEIWPYFKLVGRLLFLAVFWRSLGPKNFSVGSFCKYVYILGLNFQRQHLF